MFHGWMFDPDGDQAAADSTRSSTTLDTGSSVNPRTARRLVTASYTSMIAYLHLLVQTADNFVGGPKPVGDEAEIDQRRQVSVALRKLGAGDCITHDRDPEDLFKKFP